MSPLLHLPPLLLLPIPHLYLLVNIPKIPLVFNVLFATATLMIAITAFLEGVVWTARDLSIFLLPKLNSFYSIVLCLISFPSMLDMFYSCKQPQSLPIFYSFLFHPFFWHLARGGVLRIDIPLMASFDAATSLFTCIYRSALLRCRQTSMYLSSLLFFIRKNKIPM